LSVAGYTSNITYLRSLDATTFNNAILGGTSSWTATIDGYVIPNDTTAMYDGLVDGLIYTYTHVHTHIYIYT